MQIAIPRPATGPRIATAAPSRWTLTVAAMLSLGAAWVHLAYVAPHLRQWWAYGAFFLATGIGQALFAPLILRRPRPWLAVVGIAGNIAIVAMYVLSRINGAPFGPHANVPERVGAVDLATAAAEVVLIALLVTVLGRRARRTVANVLTAAGAVIWVLRLTGHLP
jgi:uncharacterized membrane-anchored protein